jgi:hypothetical protein
MTFAALPTALLPIATVARWTPLVRPPGVGGKASPQFRPLGGRLKGPLKHLEM